MSDTIVLEVSSLLSLIAKNTLSVNNISSMVQPFGEIYKQIMEMNVLSYSTRDIDEVYEPRGKAI